MHKDAVKWLVVGVGLVLAGPAVAQKTPNQLQQENVTNFPSCGTQCIDAFKLRSFNSDVINSTWNLLAPPLTGVTAGSYGGNAPFTITVQADGRLSLAAATAPSGSYTFNQPLVVNTTGLAATFGGMTTVNTTPSQLAMDLSQSSVSGQNPKISLLGPGYGLGQFGFGVSGAASQLDYMAPSGASHNFYVNGVQELKVDSLGLIVGTGGFVSSTSPTRIGMDGTFSSVAGANPKLQFNGNSPGANVNGIGLSAGGTDYMVGGTNVHRFWTNGTETFQTGVGRTTVGFAASAGSTSPTQLAMDQTFSSVAGQNPKINIFGSNYGIAWGFGVSSGSLDYMVPASTLHNFYVNGVQQFRVSAGSVTVGTGASAGSTTPTQIAFDQTFSSVAGANPKINLLNSGYGVAQYGFGVSSSSLDYQAPGAAGHNWYLGGNKIFGLTSTTVTALQPIIPPTYTIATLPTCNAGLTGARAQVSNAQATPTWLGTVSTTGTVTAPVFCNGTAWVYG